MSAKPTDLARWGETTGGVETTNLTIAPSGTQDIGWDLGEDPSSGVFNWFMNRSYRWFKWLDDGDVSFHDVTIGGTLGIAGDMTIGGTLGVIGTTTLSDTVVDGTLTVGGQALTFTAFTFTADNATETFTKTAHGLETGDGPIRVSNSGGALPSGLSAGTDYWVIKTGANTFKLATSFANAIAGSNLLISTDGTGTQTLSAVGGTTRATDAAVSRNLSVGGTVAHGISPIMIPACGARAYGTGVQPVGALWQLSDASDRLQLPIALPAGDRLLEVDLWYLRTDNTAEFDINLQRQSMTTGTINTIATASVTGAASGLERTTLTANYTLLADEQYYVDVTFTGGSSSLYHAVGIRRDHPTA